MFNSSDIKFRPFEFDGTIRQKENNYLRSPSDVAITQADIKVVSRLAATYSCGTLLQNMHTRRQERFQIMSTISDTDTDTSDLAPTSSPTTIKKLAEDPDVFHDAHLLAQTNVMYEFAMENGFDVPPILIKNYSMLTTKTETGLSEQELGELASIHQQLRRIVAPATPQALQLIESERRKGAFLSFIAFIPIVRHIVLASIFFLTSFILIGQLDIVNLPNLQKGILSSSGLEAIAVLGYLVSCAGLGACFTSLYRLREYITDVNYDPRYNSTYWASILLGIIAGLFISELLYASLMNQDASGSTSSSPMADLGKPALALLGGFSANMVYKMLQRIVDAIGSIFKGDQKAITKARRVAELSELKQKQDQVQMAVANRLVALSELMESQPDKARSEMKDAISELLKK